MRRIKDIRLSDEMSEESIKILDEILYCSKKLEIDSSELLEAIMIYADRMEK